MNCPECDALLQQRLDGLFVADAGALEQHLAECVSCRELHAAAGLFAEGLRSLHRPIPPLDLTSRIVGQLLAERQARRNLHRRLLTAVAAAACLVVLPLAGYLLTRPTSDGSTPNQPGPVAHVRPEVPSSSLQQSAVEAGSAVAALTDRLAGQTKEQARVWWSVAAPAGLPTVTPLPQVSQLEQPLDPAARSLREAGQGVSVGLQTVAGSARQAVDYFFRELPSLEGGNRTVQ